MNERAHSLKIVDQFTRWAKPFAELAVHADGDGMTRSLAAAEIGPHMNVLDVACGPGIVACVAARHAAHVTGVDLTPAMIAQARKRQCAEGLANLAWQVGDATHLPFDDGAFDVVLTRYSFHHMPAPGDALQEMARVCRPGGRVVFIDATPAPDKQAAYDRMERLRDPSHASALTLDQLRALGRNIGLIERAIDFYRLEAILETLAETRDIDALTALFEADMADGLDRIGVAAWRADDGIRFKFPISIVAWDRPG